MGGQKCCIHFKLKTTNKTNKNFLVKVLAPTYFGGNDYISAFENNYGKQFVS